MTKAPVERGALMALPEPLNLSGLTWTPREVPEAVLAPFTQAREPFRDAWAGNPDTDKAWGRQ